MQRWPNVHAALLGLALAACGADPAPQSGGAGAPRTGGEPANEAQANAPSARETDGLTAQRVAVAALLERSGQSADLATLARAPLVDVALTLDEATQSFSAVVGIDVVNTTPRAQSELTFVVPANSGTLDPPVTLDRIEVDGTRVDPRGTRARWVVPVTLAPGQRRHLELRLAGSLAVAPRAVAAAADGAGPLAALAGVVPGGLVPFIGMARPEEAYGEAGGVTVLAGIVPLLEGTTRMTAALALTVPADVTVVASGLETARERQGATSTWRFVAVDVPDVAAVVARGYTSTPMSAGGVRIGSVHPSEGGATADDLLATARRALETLEPAWGRSTSGELHIVACPRLDDVGVAVLPGIVLVPAALYRGQPMKADDDLVGAVLARHPAPREALQYAVARAVAAQWWLGRGADAAAQVVLEGGVAGAAALRVVAAMNGDKVVRRVLDVVMRLPLQLRLGDGDPVLAAIAMPSEIALLKAALFVEVLQRHLGDALLDEAMRGLAPGPITLDDWRAAVLARAPRRAETEKILGRWLDEAHADADVGSPNAGALLEHFVTEGALDSGLRLALDVLGDRPELAAKGLSALGNGDPSMLALDLLDELAGDKQPDLKKWLGVARGLLGSDRDKAVGALVDDLGAELGIPEAERARLRQMSELLTKVLGESGASLPEIYEPLAPPDPAVPGDAP